MQLSAILPDEQPSKEDVISTDLQAVGSRNSKHVEGVFEQTVEGGVDYRTLNFAGTLIVMIKSNIGLGVIGIPSLFMQPGLVPGVLAFFLTGVMHFWTAYVIGDIKRDYVNVYAIEDIGYIMAGKWGKELLAGSELLFAFNVLSDHGTCTAVFIAVAAVMSFCFASVQTLNRLSWLATAGVTSIFVAVFVMMIAVGVQDRQYDAPQEGPWDKNLILWGNTGFASIGSALGGMTYTLANAPAFFHIHSEMKNPKRYGLAVLCCGTIIVVVDITVGIVVYYFCGQYVASPAPGLAGPLFRKIIYGLAFFWMLMTTVVLVHWPSKQLFVRNLRNSEHLTRKTWQHWTVWLGTVAAVVIAGYLVGSAIPIFSSLSSLIGALFGPAVSLQPIGIFWLYHNIYRRHLSFRDGSTADKLWTLWAVFVVVGGTFVQVSGTYGLISDIVTAYRQAESSRPWSCANNA